MLETWPKIIGAVIMCFADVTFTATLWAIGAFVAWTVLAFLIRLYGGEFPYPWQLENCWAHETVNLIYHPDYPSIVEVEY